MCQFLKQNALGAALLKMQGLIECLQIVKEQSKLDKEHRHCLLPTVQASNENIARGTTLSAFAKYLRQ